MRKFVAIPNTESSLLYINSGNVICFTYQPTCGGKGDLIIDTIDGKTISRQLTRDEYETFLWNIN